VSQPRFLTVLELISINEMQVSAYGGVYGLAASTQSMISVISSPLNRWNIDGASIPMLAADYASTIMKQRPFTGGNRRTALTASCTFLGLNGYQLSASEAEVAVVFVELAAGQVDEASLADWFVARSVPLDS
jgi:death-on-curing protein